MKEEENRPLVGRVEKGEKGPFSGTDPFLPKRRKGERDRLQVREVGSTHCILRVKKGKTLKS